MLEAGSGQGGPKQSRLRAALADSPWFSALTAAVQDEMLAHFVERRFEAGEAIYGQGEEPNGLFGILSGTLHTIGISPDGQRILISVLRAGEWTGFIGVLDGRPNSFSTIAASPLSAVFLAKSKAAEILLKDSGRAKMLVRPLVEVLRFAYRYLGETNGRPPKQIIAQRLMDLSHCIYIPGLPASPQVDSVSQDDLAAATYLTRPTVNRSLKQFARNGLVRLGYGKIELADIPALHEIARASKKGASSPVQISKPSRQASQLALARPISIDRMKEILLAGPWFGALPPDLADPMLAKLEPRRLAVGDALYPQGSECEGIFAILSGQMSIYNTATDGRRTLMALVQPGEWTGFVPLFDGKEQPLSCVAKRPSVAALLPADVVLRLFEASAERYLMLAMPPLATLRFLHDFLINTNGREPVRLVAQRLYDLARVPWLNTLVPRQFMDNLSQSDIAEATGLSRPSVNKALGDLAKSGLVELGYGKIKIMRPQDLLAVARAVL